MTKWYRACVNYIHSVPEYNGALEQERFTEKAAIAAIHKLKRYYDEKHFVKDPDYMVRMDRLLSVIKDHETDEEMDQWKVWLKYFVTMGGQFRSNESSGGLERTFKCINAVELHKIIKQT